jgi:hypothetical protein
MPGHVRKDVPPPTFILAVIRDIALVPQTCLTHSKRRGLSSPLMTRAASRKTGTSKAPKGAVLDEDGLGPLSSRPPSSIYFIVRRTIALALIT